MSKRRRTCLALAALAALAGVSARLPGQAAEEQIKAKSRLLARQAARVDAMRKLAERINGLTITSQTRVRDFVAEEDRIETALMAYLSGMREVGEPKFLPDGICEVKLEITIDEIIVTLKKLHKEYYKGGKIQAADFEQMAATNQEKTLRETGSGAPRPEFEQRGQAESAVVAAGWSVMSQKAWEYWSAHCTGRGRLSAVRAAEAEAFRRLGERISGLMITSETSVRDFVAESDVIETEMTSFIRGAKTVDTRYHEQELIAEVIKEVTVAELIANLKKWTREYYKGNKVSVQDFERLTVRIDEKTIRETGMGVPKEEYLKDLPPAGLAAVSFADAAAKWPPAVRAKGNAAIDTANPNAAQAKLMAFKAAELDARSKLAEEIAGLQISSRTTVRDFVGESDQIRTSLLTYQQGARRVKDSEKVFDDGTVEVTVEIDTEPLWNVVLYYQQRK